MTEPRPDELPYEDAPKEIRAALKGAAPTVQQWRAISHGLSPRSVVAGAGSGKTAVMAARVVYLALVASGRLEAEHRGAMPSEVLCLTFTNKAGEELAKRVRTVTEALGLPEGEEATVLTYHAFAARLLEDHGLAMGLEPGQRLLSEAQRWQLVTALLDDMEFEWMEVRSDYVVGLALGLADECANHRIEPSAVAEHARAFLEELDVSGADDKKVLWANRKRAEIADLAQAYVDRKREIGAVDYGDQITLACDLVEAHPEVAEAFRARFPVVLLDEYQDTNVAQAWLLRRLCGDGHPVFAVGDPDQNIYAWRGASLGNLLRFMDEFGGEGDPSPLYVNFRSGSRILEVADEVIAPVPGERRAADKELRPHPDRGEGRVEAFVATDAYDEGRRIAEVIHREAGARAEDGVPRWGEMAILCRKSRLFEPIAEVLRAERIPFEVVDLGGLLRLPEVVDVVAWLRLINDPLHNVSLARILLGPRWRIGYRDLRVLAAWSAARTRGLQEDLPSDDDTPGDVAFALVEALEHLGDEEMAGLSEEARARLSEFREVLARVREAAAGPLGDLVSVIVEESGLLAELEASDDPGAVGARRNLLNLVQYVSGFAPLEGDASLATLVDFLDAAEERENELERAQPSDDNTVKILTIHKAKGLEWDVVFVAGLAQHERATSSIFPDTSRQANPATQAQTLPFELRGDADLLPAYEGDVAAFRAALEERGMEEERRLAYVAFTRARDLLVASCAHWYDGPRDHHVPGAFYELVAAHPSAVETLRAEVPEESPLIGVRAERAAEWPPPARDADEDDLFPGGWHAAAVEAVLDPRSVEARVDELPAADAAEQRSLLEGHRERAALIGERTAPDPTIPVPRSVSVSAVIDYERCPQLFYWSHVRPLPRRPSVAARVGSEVHRWIELQSRGQAALLDLDAEPVDMSGEERAGEVGDATRLRRAFEESRFASEVPLYAERPFVLALDGSVVRGRIDAVFGEPAGPWELVDYKTGRVPQDTDDPLVWLQLDLYALAAVEIWGKRPEDLRLTYLYLSDGTELSRDAGDVEETRARVLAALGGAARGVFDPTPGPACFACDFRPFCLAGQSFVRQSEGSPGSA